MCLKKSIINLPIFYKTDNLYIGLLGYVTKNGRILTITSDDEDRKFIIYRKVKFNYCDYVAQDIFTKKRYFFWEGNKYERDTIFRAVNDYAIYKSFPIEQFLDVPRKYVSKGRLLEVYTGLNTKKLEEPQKNDVTINDNLLKTILEAGEKLKVIMIDESLKDGFRRELDELAQYYVRKMTELSSNGLNLDDNEYSIRMEVIRLLADIDMRINDPDIKRNYQLKRDYQAFKQQLDSN